MNLSLKGAYSFFPPSLLFIVLETVAPGTEREKLSYG